MKTVRLFLYLPFLFASLFAATMISCSSSDDAADAEPQPQPTPPVENVDWKAVPAEGGTIMEGDLAITFPSATFDSDEQVGLTTLEKGQVGGEHEASPFYRLTLPASSNKPFTVKMKTEQAAGDLEFVVRSPGYGISVKSDVSNEATLETTYSNGEYTAVIPAFNVNNDQEQVNITFGLCQTPQTSEVKADTRANHSVVGVDGNVSWELDIDYWSKYSLDYKALEAKLPAVNLLIKECVKQIHDLGFKLPDGVKLNYHIANTESWIFGDSYGYFSRSLISRNFDGIWLKDVLVKYSENKDMGQLLKQTIIHETLHNFQSYYLPSALPKPLFDDNAMYEMGAVWIEKFMNDGKLNGRWQMEEAGLYTTFKNHFRFGPSTEKIDIMEQFIDPSPFAEYGYALGPLLYYMISQKYAQGYDDTVIASLYDSYWGRIATEGKSIVEVLDEWYNTTYVKTDEEFFSNVDNINNYYLALWRGEVMKDFNLLALERVLQQDKMKIDILNESNSKISLNGKVYALGCEGMVFKMDNNSFKDTPLNDQEMVVKQEGEGLKTYLFYTHGNTIIQHPVVAKKNAPITLSGAELEALRTGSGFNSVFFLLTVTDVLYIKGYNQSQESVEIQKAPSNLKMTKVNSVRLYLNGRIRNTSTGKEETYSTTFSSFDKIDFTQEGSTVHFVCTNAFDENYSDGSGYAWNTTLEFDIVDFNEEAFSNPHGYITSTIKDLTLNYFSKSKYSSYSPSEYKSEDLKMALSKMTAQQGSSNGYYEFGAERVHYGTTYYVMDKFNYTTATKDRDASAKEKQFIWTDDTDNIINLQINYEYTK